ncbi:non-hydrolyzing UDP-N-acetylglucosamine 2-epimerase [Microbacterium sp. NPDC055521]
MRILSVVGARPQFVKLAPIARELGARADHVIVHTGQHYDELLSDVFFSDLGIPAPDVNLEVGSALHGKQTGDMLIRLEKEFTRLAPDVVLVYGDTNSTLAAAIAAVKMHIPVAHLEAGLRSFNRAMPEEHNRVLTDHAADLLLAPTEVAMQHLADEGLEVRSRLVGDVMTDVLYFVRDRNVQSGVGSPEGVDAGGYYVATIHRPSNTDEPGRLAEILSALGSLDAPVLLFAHPRLMDKIVRSGFEVSGSLQVRAPLPYPELVSAVVHSRGVITDSGGLQKEAFLLRVPTTTIRPETEWVETVDLGWNVLANDPARIPDAVRRRTPAPTGDAPYGDGHAARRVADVLLEHGSTW